MHEKTQAPPTPGFTIPRTIRFHECTEADRLLQIHAGPSGPGGAPVRYRVMMPVFLNDQLVGYGHDELKFQQGPICENGINGITIECLLAILIDRLHRFQQGPYPCDENKKAEALLALALGALKKRTRRRQDEVAAGKLKPDAISPGEQLTRRYFTDSELKKFIDRVMDLVDRGPIAGKEAAEVIIDDVTGTPTDEPTPHSDNLDHPPKLRCHCRNVAMGSHEMSVVIPTPEFIRGEFGCKTNKEQVSIDLCIVPEILWLWSKGIITHGSCCGHGKQEACVCVDDSSIEKMKELGYDLLPDHPHIFFSRSIRYTRDEASE